MEDIKGIKTVGDLVDRIESNEKLGETFGEKPTEVLRAADIEMRTNVRPVPNTFVYWAAVLFVGFALIITVVGGFYLEGTKTTQDTPEWVIAVISTGIGALAGMLRA